MPKTQSKRGWVTPPKPKRGMPNTVHVRAICNRDPQQPNSGLIRRRDILLECLRRYKWMTYFEPLNGGKIIRLGDLGGNRYPPLYRLTVHFPDGHVVQVYKDTEGDMYVTPILQ